MATRKPPVILAPKQDRSNTPSSVPSGSGNSSSGSGNGSGGGGSGGGGYDPRAAERRALRRERQAKNKTAQQLRENAALLNINASALRESLRAQGRRRKQLLSNVRRRLSESSDQYLMGFEERREGLLGSARDNEAAYDSASTEAAMNRGRERTMAMSEIAAQGAGETDALRAQAMSLRNWAANQAETNRSMFDTLRSINSTISDLNIDTRTGLFNAHTDANEERASIWNNYYDTRSQTQTELGNIYGQQFENYSKAKELQGGKKRGTGGKKGGTLNAGAGPSFGHLSNQKAMNRSRKQAEKFFNNSAKTQGKAYTDPGVPNWVRGFEGQEQLPSSINNLSSASAVNRFNADHSSTASVMLQDTKKASGASLRAW